MVIVLQVIQEILHSIDARSLVKNFSLSQRVWYSAEGLRRDSAAHLTAEDPSLWTKRFALWRAWQAISCCSTPSFASGEPSSLSQDGRRDANPALRCSAHLGKDPRPSGFFGSSTSSWPFAPTLFSFSRIFLSSCWIYHSRLLLLDQMLRYNRRIKGRRDQSALQSVVFGNSNRTIRAM